VHVGDSEPLKQVWFTWVPAPPLPLLSHSICYARLLVHFMTAPLKAWEITKATEIAIFQQLTLAARVRPIRDHGSHAACIIGCNVSLSVSHMHLF